MASIKKENKYAHVARAAYDLIIHKGFSDEEGWDIAAEKNIESLDSRKKGCPRAAFLGLCRGGHLKGISGSNSYVSKNYDYALYAAGEWKKDKNISKKEMWDKVQNKFKNTVRHQGQLDVVAGVLEFIIK